MDAQPQQQLPRQQRLIHHTLPCALMRAGTSKGIFIHRRDLPLNMAEWAPHLISALGSRGCDPRQIDGVGGGTSTTSKVAVVAPSRRPDADVDFTFVQVAVGKESVDFSGNCGNMLSGEVDGAGDFVEDWEYSIPGAGTAGSQVRCAFVDPAGSMTGGGLLPLGQKQQVLAVPHPACAGAYSMGLLHPSLQLTGAVCIAAALSVPGTVVAELSRTKRPHKGSDSSGSRLPTPERTPSPTGHRGEAQEARRGGGGREVVIRHGMGAIRVGVVLNGNGSVRSRAASRTAGGLFEGNVCYYTRDA
ncbi:hypothetical protein N3K66_002607 [Trichothecium roseum]|uniref:Uncharacterized protein n=1 Tax=Trichothecium roseum TaxID=47278 RepID=A0ACC0VBQ1_9HYPO|nr:hypothetical protein N3K66_002607 [Trichothecium roseum]